MVIVLLPMAHANKKHIPIYVTEDEHRQIIEHSEKLGLSRQKLLSRILNHGLARLAAGDYLAS